MGKRKLIFLFDGTGASAANLEPSETNVFRINRAISYNSTAIFYFSGVGTRRDVIARASGAGLDEIIREAYVNLGSNYQPGDEIYVFGFSRGAVAARAFSGIISKSGLILGDGLEHYRMIWEYFILDINDPSNSAKAEKLRQTLDNYVLSGDERPRIRFLGVFDSVIGTYWPRLRNFFMETRLLDLKLDEAVECGIQLLAIDENRMPSFAPLLWSGISRDDQRLEQIWMPGVHGDVGGSSGAIFLNNVALLTMIGCCKKYGNLEWDDGFIDGIKYEVDGSPFEISSERGDFANKILLRGVRDIGGWNSGNQYLHPVCKKLFGYDVINRGTKSKYNPEKISDLNSLPIYNIPLLNEEIDQMTDIIK